MLVRTKTPVVYAVSVHLNHTRGGANSSFPAKAAHTYAGTHHAFIDIRVRCSFQRLKDMLPLNMTPQNIVEKAVVAFTNDWIKRIDTLGSVLRYNPQARQQQSRR